MTEVVLVAIITAVSVVLVGIVTGASAILGGLVGGWRESKNQTNAWHREQRRSAYADLLLAFDRFHEEADAVHFSSQRRLAPVREDPLYHQTELVWRVGEPVRSQVDAGEASTTTVIDSAPIDTKALGGPRRMHPKYMC